jgi:hypothetical protein
MAELSKDTKLKISIETLIAISVGIFTTAGFYFSVQAQIKEAMEKPEPVITRQEYDLKDNAIRQEIMNNRDLIERNFEKLEKIEERLYKLN